ncbi:DUF6517 family protein [Haloarcula nitratireducens]|uniref:Lipoprotein n=1 Tax=Haloarcula nitratireducens TaxID=2487749 RepID=A0AAW4PA65_9EURY|nr:DUF6517 family protein [Halomicroarcula nitratireducens]MBX0294648.1 hypothetical protein [Halomicroarcula nitratireducens]
MRKPLLGVLVALLVVSSGCVGLITGETVAFESAPTSVDDSVLESTGYELTNSTEQNVTRTVEFAGQERTIRVVSHVDQYRRGIDFGPLGTVQLSRFVVVSTPNAEVAGQSLNPAAQWSNREVVAQVAARAGGVRDIQFESNRTTQSLGESRQVSTFSGVMTVFGQEIDVRMHAASFEHEGDVIVVFAVHPDEIDEQARVDTMLRGLEHEGN